MDNKTFFMWIELELYSWPEMDDILRIECSNTRKKHEYGYCFSILILYQISDVLLSSEISVHKKLMKFREMETINLPGIQSNELQRK